MMPRSSKNSGKRCSRDMRRSRGPSFDCKRQQKPVVQSVQLRKPGEKGLAKAKKEAERQRVMEEEERKKRTREYLQQLHDEVLEEKAILLEGAEGSQIAGSKYKEVTTRDEEVQQPSKKARRKQLGKYCGGVAVKMGGANLCKRCVSTRQDCLVYPSR